MCSLKRGCKKGGCWRGANRCLNAIRSLRLSFDFKTIPLNPIFLIYCPNVIRHADQRFTLHHSRFTIPHSHFTIHHSRFTTLHSRLIIHDSRFTIHDSRFTIHDSRFTIHDSPHSLLPVIHQHPLRCFIHCRSKL